MIVIVKEVPSRHCWEPKYHWFESVKTKAEVTRLKQKHQCDVYYELVVETDTEKTYFTKTARGWKQTSVWTKENDDNA